MGQVSASSTVLINAEPDAVLAAVADYQTVRPKILSSHYSGYQVLEGGQGAGTVATWKLQATESRVRDVKATVDVAGHTVIEKDANSTMVTNWTVAPAGPGSSVTVKTTWQGAGGVKGFFEKTFAPLGLRKIQAEVLENLKKQVEARLSGPGRLGHGPRRPGRQEADDAAHHGVGVLLPAVGALDQRRVGGVLHVAHLDQDRRVLGEVEPGQVGARVEPALADVVGGHQAGCLHLVAHGLGELHRRARLGRVERRRRVVDVEAAAGRGPAVGVDRDDGVGLAARWPSRPARRRRPRRRCRRRATSRCARPAASSSRGCAAPSPS